MLETKVDANKQLEKIVGHIKVDLDGREKTVRNQESNLGNFVIFK